MSTELREPRLSLDELGLAPPVPDRIERGGAIDDIPETDAVFAAVKHALLDGYAGVILLGPPGTSKSWTAKRIAESIAGDNEHAAVFIQFHPSYQYEDFVEAWVPNDQGGFELKPKTFLRLCEAALAEPDSTFVLVIDEISRTDAARVFGEALTYLETTKRGMPFVLSSGTPATVPRNIVILGTMNPWDRGVDDLDVALLRRFAQVEMRPDSQILSDLLTANGLEQPLVDAVVQFFKALQGQPNPMVHIGHAYFAHVGDPQSLERLWELQLRHHFRSACRLEPDEQKKLSSMWDQLVVSEIRRLSADNEPDEAGEGAPSTDPEEEATSGE